MFVVKGNNARAVGEQTAFSRCGKTRKSWPNCGSMSLQAHVSVPESVAPEVLIKRSNRVFPRPLSAVPKFGQKKSGIGVCVRTSVAPPGLILSDALK